MLRDVAERTTDRRAELLDAAVRVFARKGFHASRVGDIAEEAGVAHGLLYHYFRSKDEVLETIFRETWALLVADTERIELAGVPLREQLRRFARIYLGSWLVTPELIAGARPRGRAQPRGGQPRRRDRWALPALQRIIEAGRDRGEVRGRRRRAGWPPGPSTARSRRSSPAGCSVSCRARRKTSSARSRRSSTSRTRGLPRDLQPARARARRADERPRVLLLGRSGETSAPPARSASTSSSPAVGWPTTTSS